MSRSMTGHRDIRPRTLTTLHTEAFEMGGTCTLRIGRSVMFGALKGIIPTEIGEASEVMICGAEGQPMLDR